jgi:hypothetical protein
MDLYVIQTTTALCILYIIYRPLLILTCAMRRPMSALGSESSSQGWPEGVSETRGERGLWDRKGSED